MLYTNFATRTERKLRSRSLSLVRDVDVLWTRGRFNNSFYTKFDSSVSLHSRPHRRTHSESESPKHTAATRASRNTSGERPSVPSKASGQSNRNASFKAALL